MTNLICSIASALQSVGSILLAFVVLMIMVLIHETGHYTAGKLLGFKINEFAVGMGPKVLSKTKKDGQVVSLRAFPLGGFCAFEGEDQDNDNPQAFNKQAPWKRLIVLVAGAMFNFISAVLIAIIAFGCYGETVAKVSTIYDYAPTANHALQRGDIIYKIDGKRVFVLDNVSRYMGDEPMDFVVLRKDEKGVYQKVTLQNIQKGSYVTSVLARVKGNYVSGEVKLSVGHTIYKVDGKSISKAGDFERYLAEAGDTLTLTVVHTDGENDFVDFVVNKSDFTNNNLAQQENNYTGVGMLIHYDRHRFAFGEVLARVLPFCGETAMLVLRTLGGLITGAVGLEAVGGPISTIGMTSQIVSTGLSNILVLMVLISVNLAVFNLLPVPALDGCRIIFVLIEWIRGKPINRKVEGYVNGIGLILLLVFTVLIDLLKL